VTISVEWRRRSGFVLERDCNSVCHSESLVSCRERYVFACSAMPPLGIPSAAEKVVEERPYLTNFRALLDPFSGLTSSPRTGTGPAIPLYPNRSINNVVTSKLPASVLGSIVVAIRVLDIVVLSLGRGELALAASSN